MKIAKEDILHIVLQTSKSKTTNTSGMRQLSSKNDQ